MRIPKYLFLLTTTALAAQPALGQDADRPITEEERAEMEEQLVNPVYRRSFDERDFPVKPVAINPFPITVTASGIGSSLRDTGQSVTVIEQEEIDAVQGADFTRLVERLPGATFTRNGPVGGFTGVSMRGASADQLLVLVDGVRVADTSSPAGGFDFANLLASDVSNIDLQRGSNSTIWGSDAIGGVMVVTTRRAAGLSGSIEYGTDDTLSVSASGGIDGQRHAILASVGWFHSDGFSAAASGSEADGFEQLSLGASAFFDVTDEIELFANARYAEGELEIDGFPFPSFTLSDTLELQNTTQYSGALGASYYGEALTLKATFSLSDTERVNSDPAFGETFSSDGESERVALRGKYSVSEVISIGFGGEHEWSRYETLFDAGASTRIAGAYGQIGISSGGFNAHMGVRQDDHQRFGGATSLGADISYAFGDGWRVRASSGEGFKAPTLFQLFSDFGNEQLQPERSRSYDIAIEHGQRGDSLHAALTLFRRDSNDLIEFVSCFGSSDPICTDRPFGTYNNVAKARAQGFEVELGAKVSERLSALAVYSHVDTENRTAGAPNEGNVLARRPQHALTASLDWAGPQGIGLGADIRMVSDSFDDAGNFTRLDGYQVVTLRASKAVGEKFELFGRVENLFDTNYQTAAGYNSRDRAVFVGARVQM